MFKKKILKGLKQILPEEVTWFLCKVARLLRFTRPSLYDISGTSRIVEYGWALQQLPRVPARVLDVGCSDTMFPLVMASMGYQVIGTDFKGCNIWHPYFTYVNNTQMYSMPKNYFDVVTLISTIEHIGLDSDGDFKCMKDTLKLLKPGGKMILTAPFGQSAVFKGHRVYDIDRLMKLSKKVDHIEYFVEQSDNIWIKTTEVIAGNVRHISKASCPSIACWVITK